MGEGIKALSKLSCNNAKIAELPITITEIRAHARQLRKAAQGGPDIITNHLLFALVGHCPTLSVGQ